MKARAKRVIATFDKNSDNKLNIDELTALLPAKPQFGLGGRLTPEINRAPMTAAQRAEAMLKAYDANEDGSLNADELVTLSSKRKAHHSRSGGGNRWTAPHSALEGPPTNRPRIGSVTPFPTTTGSEIPSYWEYARRYTPARQSFVS